MCAAQGTSKATPRSHHEGPRKALQPTLKAKPHHSTRQIAVARKGHVRLGVLSPLFFFFFKKKLEIKKYRKKIAGPTVQCNGPSLSGFENQAPRFCTRLCLASENFRKISFAKHLLSNHISEYSYMIFIYNTYRNFITTICTQYNSKFEVLNANLSSNISSLQLCNPENQHILEVQLRNLPQTATGSIAKLCLSIHPKL